MNKILYNLNGQQYLEQCIGVTSDAQILWDESINGPMPAVTLGFMEASDVMQDVPGQFLPQLDSNNQPVLDVNGNIVYTTTPVQKLTHVLIVLPVVIPSHAAAVALEAQAVVNATARAYLASTDWMVIREVEGGTACPSDVKAARAAARLQVV